MDAIQQCLRNFAAEKLVLSIGAIPENFKESSGTAEINKSVSGIKTDVQDDTFDLTSNFNDNSKFYNEIYTTKNGIHKNLLEIHPGHKKKFSELFKTMEPVLIPDLENIEGVMGSIEGKHFNIAKNIEPQADKLIKPLADAIVWVEYAYFLEGSSIPYDNSVSRLKGKPFVIQANSAHVIPGMVAAMRWLAVGQRGYFLLPPDTNYGPNGLHGLVPPNSTLLLLIHLLHSIDAGAIQRYENLNDESKKDFRIACPLIESVNNLAKDFFFRKKLKQSSEVYIKSIEFLKNCTVDEFNKEKVNSLFVKTYVNLALCMDLMGHSRKAIFYLDEASVLEDYLKNCKALFLRGRSHFKLLEYEDAKTYLLAAFKIQPSNVEIGVELQKLEKILSGWKKLELNISKNLSKEMHSVGKNLKLEEHLLSTTDRDEVDKKASHMIEHNIKRFYVHPRLLEEEVKILGDIFKDKKDFEFIKVE